MKSITAADDNAEYKCKAKSGDSEYIEAIRLTLAGILTFDPVMKQFNILQPCYFCGIYGDRHPLLKDTVNFD